MRMRRALAVVLCLLLLSLQSQALVHPLAHLGVGPERDTVVAAPTLHTSCLQCALLEGSSAASLASSATFLAACVADLVVVRSSSPRTTGATAWFRSRAPPALLA